MLHAAALTFGTVSCLLMAYRSGMIQLVFDIDFIEQGAERGAPKYTAWYAAFGLLVTLVWLYIEILHLLMKLQSRD